MVGISHRFLTDWPDGTGLWQLYRTPGRTLTCGYGFRRAGRTRCIDLRIRCSPKQARARRVPDRTANRGNSRSLPAKRTRRPSRNGPALRNQATDLLSRRSATDRQQIAPDPPCRSKCSNCTERIPSGSSAVSTRPPCSVSVPPEARNQRKMPTTSHRLQTGQAQGRRHEPCSAGTVAERTGALPLPEALNHRSAVQRNDPLDLGGPVHEGRQIVPGIPGQPPVFDHAGR